MLPELDDTRLLEESAEAVDDAVLVLEASSEVPEPVDLVTGFNELMAARNPL